VKYFVKKDSKVYCVSLDSSKAFDKVLHHGLLVKLFNKGVPVVLIRLLCNWYSRLRCSVLWNTALGDVFSVNCGVRQGGVLSPILFSIYVDDLISLLPESGYGMYIDRLFTGCILYADDILLLSSSCNACNLCCIFVMNLAKYGISNLIKLKRNVSLLEDRLLVNLILLLAVTPSHGALN